MDVASPWQFSFSDLAIPIMEGIMNFHKDLMFFIVVISIFVICMLVRCIMVFSAVDGDEVLGWNNQVGYLGYLVKNSNIRIFCSISSTEIPWEQITQETLELLDIFFNKNAAFIAIGFLYFVLLQAVISSIYFAYIIKYNVNLWHEHCQQFTLLFTGENIKYPYYILYSYL